MLDKKLVMRYKQVFLFIKEELQTSIENNISCKKERKVILVEWGWTENNYHSESYGKTNKKMNTPSENMTYIVDKKQYVST